MRRFARRIHGDHRAALAVPSLTGAKIMTSYRVLMARRPDPMVKARRIAEFKAIDARRSIRKSDAAARQFEKSTKLAAAAYDRAKAKAYKVYEKRISRAIAARRNAEIKT
jgi:hypothetical protein